LPTTLVSVTYARSSAEGLAIRLRLNQPAVIVRVGNDRVLLDLRTVLNEAEENQIVQAFQKVTMEMP
jgi:L-seryl-tRNA(Ser) seleniumtransferase